MTFSREDRTAANWSRKTSDFAGKIGNCGSVGRDDRRARSQAAAVSGHGFGHGIEPDANPDLAGAIGHAAHVVQTVVCQRIDPNWRQSYGRVGRVLLRTVRASSLVECMNSVIRMHQARHRTLTQPMMDLKRLYWNCRPFREGQRRGRSPYEHLELRLPSYDFWQLLTMDPEDLTQKLSTPRVAA